MFTYINSLDQRILLLIQQYMRSGTLDSLMVFFTRLGNWGLVWIFLAGALLIYPKTRHTAVLTLTALFLTFLMGEAFLKNLIQRPRPIDETIRTLLFHLPVTYSFPSGHAASSFAAAGVLAKHFRQHAILLYGLATVIAFSRVYLTLHYPSDLLAGLLLGLACSLMVIKIDNRKKKH